MPTPEPLPVEVVRDLLAVLKVMYRGERDELRRIELAEIGRLYRLALRLAKAGPDTLGGKASWRWAEEATDRLTKLIDYATAIGPGLLATAGKLKR